MRVYKFMNSAFADQFSAGSVRVSPAYVMRESDGFVAGRSDAHELTRPAIIAGGSENVRSDHPGFPDDMFVFIKAGKRVHFDMTIVGESLTMIDNAFLFCTATDIDDGIRARMVSDFDADAVFAINDIDAFAAGISADPKLAGLSLVAGTVSYCDPIETSVAKMPPVDVFQKRTPYAWQREHRLVWRGEVTEPTGFNIQAPGVIPLLERLPDTKTA